MRYRLVQQFDVGQDLVEELRTAYRPIQLGEEAVHPAVQLTRLYAVAAVFLFQFGEASPVLFVEGLGRSGQGLQLGAQLVYLVFELVDAGIQWQCFCRVVGWWFGGFVNCVGVRFGSAYPQQLNRLVQVPQCRRIDMIDVHRHLLDSLREFPQPVPVSFGFGDVASIVAAVVLIIDRRTIRPPPLLPISHQNIITHKNSGCCVLLLPLEQPLQYAVEVLLYVLGIAVPQLQNYGFVVCAVHLVVGDLQQLAVYILQDLVGCVPAGLQPVVQVRIIASQQHHQIEISHREELAAVELKQQSSLVNLVVLLDEVQQLVLIELRHVEFLIPRIVQLVGGDHLADVQVAELQRVVEQFGQGGLAAARGAGDQDVGSLALLFHLHYYFMSGFCQVPRKIADHGDFLRVGLQRSEAELVGGHLKEISHTYCKSTAQNLEKELGELRENLASELQTHLQFKQWSPGLTVLLGGVQYSVQASPQDQFQQQHFERERLYYEQLAMQDRARGVQTRDTIADRSHPRVFVGDKQSQITMLREQLRQTQFKLFSGRMQSTIPPVEYQLVEDQNQYLKSMVLAEAEILSLQQPVQVESGGGNYKKAQLLQTIKQKHANIMRLQQRSQAANIPTQLEQENAQLQAALQSRLNQKHFEKIQEAAYLTVLRNQLQTELQEKQAMLRNMEAELTGQPAASQLQHPPGLSEPWTAPLLLRQIQQQQQRRQSPPRY